MKRCKTCGGKLPDRRYVYCSLECKFPPRPCAVCGDVFQPPRADVKTCGNECRQRSAVASRANGYKVRACKYCGAEFQPQAKNQKFCSKEHQRSWFYEDRHKRKANGKGQYEFVCKGCGITYHTDYKNRDQYHSRECAYEHRPPPYQPPPRPRSCLRCEKEYLLEDGYNLEYCSSECHDVDFTFECAICRRVGVGQIRSQVLCGEDACREEYERARKYERQCRLHAELAPVHKCKVCGYEFCPLYGGKARSFCSDQCREIDKKRHRHRSAIARAQHYGVHYREFNELLILERDNWTCYICGRATPRKLRGTFERNAPEIDHVIPLSKGGTHTPDNVRCCCRSCNSIKGNKPLKAMRQRAIRPLPLEVEHG